jgi:hypothetical protein
MNLTTGNRSVTQTCRKDPEEEFMRRKREKRREDYLNQLPAITTITATVAPAAPATAPASAASAPAAISATATAWSPAATASSTFCLRPRFVHNQVPPAKILAIEGINGAIGVFIVGHLHKRKSSGLARETVANEIDARRSYTNLREPFIELILRRGKRKISDIELLHLRTPSVRNPSAESRSAQKKHLSSTGSRRAEPPRTQTMTSAVSGILSKIYLFCNRK